LPKKEWQMMLWRLAESATFNYAQVTPFIRRIREAIWGYPFVTFTYKATPIAVETMLKHPRRVSALGKIKLAIEQQAGLEELIKERASEPPWVRDGFYIKLPIKDKYGRSAYFDLTYIIPFGDLVSGQFFERGYKRETGLPKPVGEAFLEKSPLLGVIKAIARNEDFYGNKIYNESDPTEKQLGDLFRYLVKIYSPPLIADQLPGGYITRGEFVGQRRPSVAKRVRMAGEGTQYRTLMEEMLRNVGLKIQPIDLDIQETYSKWEKRKALETLLQERGVLKEFRRLYIPR